MNSTTRDPDETAAAEGQIVDGDKIQGEAHPDTKLPPVEVPEVDTAKEAGLTWDSSDWFKIS